MSAQDSLHIGLLAAWGRYPLIVAAALRRQSIRVSCLAVRDHADPELAKLCDDFVWIGIAQLGRAIRHFRRLGVRHATMAGKFHKVVLYRPWFWLRHLPDWQTIRTFYPLMVTGKKDQKDDTLLGTLAHAFGEAGIDFHPATDYVPELLVPRGLLAGRPPSVSRLRDIRFGWQLAKEMGRLDVGQSVCVKDQAVLAVEAIEGTDACIQRAGQLCRKGRFTVVKVAKPQQDMRFDVPTVGLGTLETMVNAGADVLAIEAGRTILLDADAFCRFAKRHGLTVIALDSEPSPRPSLESFPL